MYNVQILFFFIIQVCLSNKYAGLSIHGSFKINVTASYIGKGCLRDDPNLNECVVRKGAPVIDRIVKGDPKYRIPKLDPLVIPALTIEQGTKQVGLKMTCKNCELHGLKDTRFVRAR